VKDRGLISIVMPVYNGELHIQNAIESVLNQTYENWELLIINDGSTDNTLGKVQLFSDERIRIYTQTNKGVSFARNVGLSKIKGEFLCFLDADDTMPKNSLAARVQLFENPDVSFVDGSVDFIAESTIVKTYCPSLFLQNPREELIRLTGSCFMGLSWMIRNHKPIIPFRSELSHCEDLVFFIENSEKGLYTFTSDCILHYNQNENSAMKNLKGLEQGYLKTYTILADINTDAKLLNVYRWKFKSIMFKSFLKNGEVINALKTIVK